MSITVSAVKARQNLGELLNIVSLRHEDVIIERAGKKIARLTTLEEKDAVHEPVAEYRTQKTVQRPSLKKKIKTKMTLAEQIRKDREEWAKADTATIREAVEMFRSIRGLGKEMWEATGLTPDEYVQKEREEWD